MHIRTLNPDKVIRIATIAALSFMICWGFVMVVVQVKPFWVDEWRIIYNLKYKDAGALMGPLDFMQQFPRVYLEVIKAFTSLFDYSYFSLRFPSFLVGVISILFSYRLMDKIFYQKNLSRFLFVIIIIAYPAFFEYFVQVKQYTMDILLGLLAIWQLLQLQEFAKRVPASSGRYLLVCLSFLIAPFFSYTYPIVIAPLFLIVFIHSIKLFRAAGWQDAFSRLMMKLWLPLLSGGCAIIVFYIIDASQLMKDNKMHFYWGYMMMQGGFKPVLFCRSFYNLFALSGSGLVFEVIYGVLGILAFIHAIVKCVKSLPEKKWGVDEYLAWYSSSLIVLVMLLYSLGKIPVGEARLHSFIIPVVAILLISLINDFRQIQGTKKIVRVISMVLFIGGAGSVITSPVNEWLDTKHDKTLSIYVNTENAIVLAGIKNIPIFITSGIAYPYQKIINYPCTNIAATALCFPLLYENNGCSNLIGNLPGDWVLKTFPAYKVGEHTLVYALNDLSELKQCMLQLPPYIKSVIAGDGNSFREIKR